MYRSMMMAAAIFALAGIAPRLAHAATDVPANYYQDQKVVYHNNGRGKDSAEYFKALLKNLTNHIDAVGKDHVEIKVVSHGEGFTLFQQAQTDKETAASLDALRGKGVQFLICKNTLTERKIDWKQLYGVKEDHLVPAGVAELIRLQQKSYLYIHP